MNRLKLYLFLLSFISLLSCNSSFYAGTKGDKNTNSLVKFPIVESSFSKQTLDGLDTSANLKLKTQAREEMKTPITGPYANQLVSLWRFNGSGSISNAANIFTDEVSGHTGQAFTGGSMAFNDSGVFNEAVTVNGSSDYILVNDHVDYQITGALTISAWLYPTINQEGNVFERGGDSGVNGGYQLNIDAGTNGPSVKFRVNSDATTSISSGNSQELFLNQWNHVVGVYIPGKKIQVYLNGVISNQNYTSVPSSIHVPMGENVFIGLADAFTEYFAGSLDEVALWKRPLSPSEVKNLYLRGVSNYAISGVSNELPNNADTTGYIDMTDNAILFHFDEYKLLNHLSISDYSGTENHGTLTKGTGNDAEKTWISPLLLGLKLDGIDDYVSVSTATNIDTLDEYTVSFWVNPKKVGVQYLLSKNIDARYISLQGISESLLSISACASYSSTSACSTTDSGVIKVNKWQHITVKFSDSSKSIKIYINGHESTYSNKTAGVGTLTTPTGNLNIGRNTDGSKYFGGIIDEFSIWNRLLSDQEILDIYNKQSLMGGGVMTSTIINSGSSLTSWDSVSWTPKAPYTKSLPITQETAYTENNSTSSLLSGIIMYYRLDETSGSIFSDLSSNSNTGYCTVCPKPILNGHFNVAQEFNPFKGEAINLGNNSVTQSIESGNISFSIWIYPRSRGGTNVNDLLTHARIFDKDGSSDGDGLHFSTRRTTLNFTIDTDATDLDVNTVEGTLKFNQWNHLVLTWDGSLNKNGVKIYANGAEAAYSTSVSGTGSFDTSSNDLNLGGGVAGGNEAIDGYIDEAVFWNRIITASEVASLYKRGANQIKIQKRICDKEDCSDQYFSGPNNSPMTSYSETLNLNNSTPSLLNIAPDNKGQYFQYRIIMDSLDYNTTPELINFSINGTNKE